MKDKVELITDGACQKNPGPGGWGAILRCRGVEKELSGSHADTTNNRMELTAVIEGLSALKRPCIVHITTDSKYVMRGYTEWLAGWKANDWRTSRFQPVQNVDLWQALDIVAEEHHIEWYWVKGHSGHPDNERADRLATAAIGRK